MIKITWKKQKGKAKSFKNNKKRLKMDTHV